MKPRTDRREDLLRSVAVESLTVRVARAAGEALASLDEEINARLTVDAAVAAHAAAIGAPVITSDPEDFAVFQRFFRGLRVLTV